MVAVPTTEYHKWNPISFDYYHEMAPDGELL